MNILQIRSSARGQQSHSTRLADRLVDALRASHPGACVTVRDLARFPLPPLDEAAVGALFSTDEERKPEEAAHLALSDSLIAELEAADTIVLGVPMYNFGIPVQLKNWIDAIARKGVTFRYTERGPEGLLTGKKVYVALARGGRYRNTPADTQVPYLKLMLGFLGLSDVEFIYAEGLSMGPEAEGQAYAEASAQIREAVTRSVPVLEAKAA